jgi:hypothetical protein
MNVKLRHMLGSLLLFFGVILGLSVGHYSPQGQWSWQVSLGGASAYANCSSPLGYEGSINYFSSSKKHQYCDGTDWKDFAGSGSGAGDGALNGRYEMGSWSNTGATLPSSFYGGQLAVIGDYVYLFGGYYSGSSLNIIYRAPTSDPTDWSDTGATLPEGVRYSQVAVIGDYVYLFGGRTSSAYSDAIYRAPVSDPTDWEDTTATLPGTLSVSQAAVIGDYVYLFGGVDGSSYTNAIYRAPVSDPTNWTDTTATLPGDLGVSQVAVIGDYVYLFGGVNDSSYTSVIYRAPVSDPTSWTDTGATLPGNLAYSHVAMIGDYAYLFGGHNGSAVISTTYRAPLDDLTSWSNAGNNLPGILHVGHAAVIGDNVYLFGGSNSSSPVNVIYRAPLTISLTASAVADEDLSSNRAWKVASNSSLGSVGGGADTLSGLTCSANQIAQYDGSEWICANGAAAGAGDKLVKKYALDNENWGTYSAALPANSQAAQVITTDEYVYLIGGYNGSSARSQVYQAPVSDLSSWTNLGAVLPDVRWHATSLVVGDNVYLYGGSDNASTTNSQNTIYSAPLSDLTSWSSAGTFPIRHSRGMAVTIGTDLYIYGGVDENGDYLDTIYKSTSAAPTTWTLVSGKTLPGALSAAGIAVIGDDIYIFGGQNSGGSTNVIYKSTVADPTTWVDTSATLPGNAGLDQIAVIGDYIYIFASTTYSAPVSDPTNWTDLGLKTPATTSQGQLAVVGDAVYIMGSRRSNATHDDVYYAPITETLETATTSLTDLSKNKSWEVKAHSVLGSFGGGADSLSGLSCSANQIAKYDGSAWVCSSNASGTTKSSVEFTGTGQQTIALANNAQLYVNDSRDTWETYTSLPSYLVGLRGTDKINQTNSTMTISGGGATCYLLRSASGWNTVDLTGWALHEEAGSLINGITNVNVYKRDFEDGSYSLDVDSAMYACAENVTVTGSQWSNNSDDIHYTSGNVGIGTSSPAYALDVDGGTGAGVIGLRGDGNGTDYADLRLVDDTNTRSWTMRHSETNANQFSLGYNDGSLSEILSIKPTGEFGIGTTSPVSKLHVAGDLLLENSGTCANDNSNKGAIRLNSSSDALEICDGAGEWTALTASGGAASGGSASSFYVTYELDATSWVDTGADMPATMGGFAQTEVIGDYIYSFGGWVGGVASSVIYRAPVSNPLDWEDTGETLPSALAYSRSMVVGDYVYLFGGYNGSGATNTIFRAPVSDPTNWEDTTKTLPSNVSHGQDVIRIDDTLYIFGGWNGSSSFANIYSASVSDPTTWSDTGSTIDAATNHAKIAVIGDKIYIYGGASSTVIQSASVSNPLSWTTETDTLPTDRRSRQTAIIGDYIYLFAGYHSSGTASNAVFRAHLSDPTNVASAGSGTDLPATLFDAPMHIIGDKIYFFGGAIANGSSTANIYSADIVSSVSSSNTQPDLSYNHERKFKSNATLASGGGDTLSGLTCTTGQFAKYDGSAWVCADGSGAAGDGLSVSYKYDGLSLVQDISTLGAANWHSFTIGGETYLMVANNYDGSSYNTNSKLYKWSGSQFTEVQTFATSGAGGLDSFQVSGETYLVIGNNYDGDYTVDSKVYKWNGSAFAEVQSIAAGGVSRLESFVIDGETYLAMAYYYDGSISTSSKIYKWNGTAFAEEQSLAMVGAIDVASFTIDGTMYLAFSSYYTGSSYVSSSKVFKWDGTEFAEEQIISTTGARSINAFEIGGTMYLSIASSYNGSSYNTNSKVYKWDGTEFVELQSIATSAGQELEYFTVGDDSYLVAANNYNGSSYNIDSKIYKWNGSSFTEIDTVATNGAYSWRSFSIGDDQYLAVANYTNGSSHSIASKIFHVDTVVTGISGGSAGDTLAGLSCTSGQVAQWNGSAWVCADGAGSGGSSSLNGRYEMGSWGTTGATLPVAIGNGQVAVIGDYVYLFGGYSGSSETDKIYRAAVSDPTNWSDTGATLPGVLRNSQLLVIGGYVYLFGGYNGSATVNVIYRAPTSDPTNWSDTGATLAVGLNASQMAVIGNYVYMFGGYTGSASTNAIYRAPVSDPTDWSNTGATTSYTAHAGQLAVVGDYVYMFGGYNGSPGNGIHRAPVSDPTNWSNTGESLPSNLSWSQLLLVGDYLYLLGGHNGSDTGNVVYRAPTSDPTSWTSVGTLPDVLYTSHAAVVDGTAYLFGGWTVSAYTNKIYSAPLGVSLSTSSATSADISSNRAWKTAANSSIASIGGGSGSDSLSGLSCTSGQVASWNGTAWACADAGGATTTQTTQIAQSEGTIITTGTDWAVNTRLANAFDGNDNQTHDDSLYQGQSGSGTATFSLGKDWGAGNSEAITRLVIIGSNDEGLNNSGASTLNATFQGSNDNSSWSTIDSFTIPATTDGPTAALDRSFSGEQTAYRYHRVTWSAGNNNFVAEMKFYHDVEVAADTLAALSCTSGQVASWNGSAWACADGAGTATSMVDGWPDVINCTRDDSGTARDVFFYADHENSGGMRQYASFVANNDSTNGSVYIRFNSDGSWNSVDANATSAYGTLNCIGDSITDLYAENKAFNIVGGSSGASAGGSALTEGGFGSYEMKSADTVYEAETDGFIVSWAAHSFYLAQVEAANPPTVTVAQSEGATSSAARPSLTIPVKKGEYWRIVTYSGNTPTVRWMPVAFSTGGGGSSEASAKGMLDGWPDAIQCSTGSSNFNTFILYGRNPAGTEIYYGLQGQSASYWITYNADKTYKTHNNSGTYDCVTSAKSIATLLSEDKAYYFVGGSSASSSSGTGDPMPAADSNADDMPDIIRCDYDATTSVFGYKDWSDATNGTRYSNTTDGYVYYNNSTKAKGPSTGYLSSSCPTNLADVDGQWNIADGGGSGSGSGDGGEIFISCTNEESDGDGTGDKAACVSAATNEDGTGRYRALSCTTDGGGSDNSVASWLDFYAAGNTWRTAYANTWYSCLDGSMMIVDTQATSGGSGSGSGSGSDLWADNSGDINYTAGKVGIGTAAPAYALDVDGGTGSGLIGVRGDGDGTDYAGLRLVDDTNTRSWTLRHSETNANQFSLGYNDGSMTEMLNIKPTGEFGIGVTSPTAKLHVAGDLLLENSGTCANDNSNKGAIRLNSTSDALEICDGSGSWDALQADSVTTLAELSDVDLSGGMTDGQGLVYDADTLKWVPGIAGTSGAANAAGTPLWRMVQPEDATKILASDGEAADQLGYSVAIDGKTAVIGAPGEDTNGISAGAAYVYVQENGLWTQQQILTPTDANAGDFFGWSVAISGDSIIVGAPVGDSSAANSGAAFVFTRSGSTWTQEAELNASDAAASDEFGFSVDIKGETAIVGARAETAGGAAAGAAYTYLRTGTSWAEQDKLVAADAAANDEFGFSVALSGDTAVVGALVGDSGTADSGAAYVFTRSGATWTQEAELNASDAAANAEFGFSVDIDGDTIIVGAEKADQTGYPDAGQAYIFTRSGSTWSEQTILTAADAEYGHQFGNSVSISGDVATVGAWLGGYIGSYQGVAYVFERFGSKWQQQVRLSAPDAQVDDYFGFSVATDGDTVITGAYQEDQNGNNAGAAYIYSPQSVAGGGVLAGLSCTSGQIAQYNGSAWVCADGSGIGSGGSGGVSGREYFTADGTFTVPSGVTEIRVTVAGAGGGGASYDNNGAAGGDTTATYSGTTVTASGGDGGYSRYATGQTLHGDAANGDLNLKGAGSTGGNMYNQAAAYNYGEGGNGGLAIKDFTVSAGDTVSIVVGAGGAGGAQASYPGEDGVDGYAIVEWGGSGSSSGAGSGGTAKAMTNLLHVRDQKSNGTEGGASVAGWNDRVLNTEVTNEIDGASLSSNQIILPAGEYYIEASAPSVTSGRHQIRLRNVTDGTTIILGQTAYGHSSYGGMSSSELSGKFTLSDTKTLKIEHYVGESKAEYGLGLAALDGTEDEVYTDVRIWEYGTVGGGSGSSSSESTAIFTYCSNEESDGDGTDDVAACVAAADPATETASDPARYQAINCQSVGDSWSGDLIRMNSGVWQVRNYNGNWGTCDDGTVLVVDTQAMTGGSSGSGSSRASSMVDGWPDAIVCDVADTKLVNILQQFSGGTTARYYVVGTNDRWISFNSSDGSYNASDSNTAAAHSVDCSGKSISQLYTDEQAFNFVGGGSGSGSGDSVWADSSGDINYTSGNVGIGTASPAYALDVDGGTGTGVIGLRGDGNGTNYADLRLVDDTNTRSWSMRHSETNANQFSLGYNDGSLTEIMSIKPTGEFGIGTTSPVAKLHVAGDLLLENSGTCANDNSNKGSLRLNSAKDALEICDGAGNWDALTAQGGSGSGGSGGADLETTYSVGDWGSAGTLPGNLYGAQVAVVGDYIYLFGGYTGSAYTDVIYRASVSDPTSWTSAGTLPGSLHVSQVAVVGDYIYLFGGHDDSASTDVIYRASVSDPTSWTSAGTLPGSLHASQVAVVGDYIYLFGGADSVYTNVIYRASVSDPTSWTSAGTLPVALGYSQVAVVGDYIYLFGGYNGSAYTNVIYRASVSDPTSWTSAGTLPGAAIHASQVAVVGDYIYLFGGYNGSAYTNLNYRAPLSDPTSWTSAGTLPGTLGHSQVAVVDDSIYLFAGYTASAATNVIYRADIEAALREDDGVDYDLSANRDWKVKGSATLNVGGSDTLAGLSCTSGQVAQYNGSAWACADADGLNSGGSGSGAGVVEADNSIIAAMGGGADLRQIQDGWIDEFNSEDGVKLASSTAFYVESNDAYDSLSLQKYTGLTAGMISQSGLYWTGSAGMIDGNTSSGNTAHTDSAAAGSYVLIDLGSGNERALGQWVFHTGGAAPSSAIWDIEYSDDNSSWTKVYTDFAVNETSSGGTNTATWGDAGAHRYWRAYKTNSAQSGPWYFEMEVYEASAGDVVLTSDGYASSSQQSSARLLMLHEAVDSVTLNTDIKAYVSRDNGTTWAEATLENAGAYNATKNILAATVDLLSAGAGTSMVYKIETANSKLQKIHAVSLRWGDAMAGGGSSSSSGDAAAVGQSSRLASGFPDALVCNHATNTGEYIVLHQNGKYSPAEEASFQMTADGADASTSFTDNSPSARTITVSGDAQVDTAQKKFGTGSLLLDGTGDYLSVAADSDMAFGTGDFTVHFWVRPNGSLTDKSIFGNRNNTQVDTHWNFEITGGANNLQVHTSKTAMFTGTSNTLTASDWNHVAWTRSGGLARLFINGALVSSQSDAFNYSDASSPYYVGLDGAAAISSLTPFNGWIDDITVIKGKALWTSAFTPPSVSSNENAVFYETLDGGKSISFDGSEKSFVSSSGLGSYNCNNASLDALTSAGQGIMYGDGVGGGSGSGSSGSITNSDNSIIGAVTNNGTGVQYLSDGILDQYTDETGVDTSTSTNETYDSADDLYKNESENVVVSGVDTRATGWTNWNVRSSMQAGIVAAGNSVTVEFAAAPTGQNLRIDTAWIGNRADSGDAYDFDGNHVQLKFNGGSDGFNIAAGTTITSDLATIDLDGSKDVIVAFHVNADTATDEISYNTSPASGFVSYEKQTSDESSVSDATGYSTQAGRFVGVSKVTSYNSADMTFQSESFTASAQSNSARIMLFHEPVDSVTLNTDVKAYVSRDNGTTWSEATLVNEGKFNVATNVLAATVDLSGQPAGTSMKYRITTHNSKEQKFHAVSLRWGDAVAGSDGVSSGGGSAEAAGAAGQIQFYSGGNLAASSELVFTSGGSLGVGTSTPSQKLEVTGNVLATAFFHSSDERLKDNIQDIDGLALIEQLRGVSFDWKKDGVADMGVIAQEVEKVAPYLVSTNPDTGMKAVHYDAMIAPLIEASKELHAENEMLKTRLSNVEQDIAGLKAHTGFGIDKAMMQIWLLVLMALAGGVGAGAVMFRKRK